MTPPATWNSGIGLTRASQGAPRALGGEAGVVGQPPWVSTAALGRPVVPEVYRSCAGRRSDLGEPPAVCTRCAEVVPVVERDRPRAAGAADADLGQDRGQWCRGTRRRGTGRPPPMAEHVREFVALVGRIDRHQGQRRPARRRTRAGPVRGCCRTRPQRARRGRMAPAALARRAQHRPGAGGGSIAAAGQGWDHRLSAQAGRGHVRRRRAGRRRSWCPAPVHWCRRASRTLVRGG